jgi:copper chaperone CopZ
VTEIANTPNSLPLLEDPTTDSGGCGCGGCGCGASDADSAATTSNSNAQENPMSTHTYAVSGMTCGHCATTVTSELKSLDGVTDVHVDLVAGGTSTVTVASQAPLDDIQVRAALEEAGEYRLVQR